MRKLAFTLLALLPVLPAVGQETLLRHQNYLAFNGTAGEAVKLVTRALPRAPYHEDLQLLLLDSGSRRVLEETVPVGSSRDLDYPVATTGLHVLSLSSGQCLATARTADRPFALLASQRVPLWICGSCARQYFLVPAGFTSFDLYLQAEVTGEGARLRVWQPDGSVAVDRSEDFDASTRIRVPVPKGQDGQPWAFTLDKPEDGKLVLDDVQLYLGRELPPYLCEQAEWPAGFVTTGEREQISRRVPLALSGLRDGRTTTVTFTLEAVPAVKMAALRALAGDVDYATEGTFTLNGHGPYAIPETGDGTVLQVTVPLKPADLQAGENTLVFKHDSRQSSGMTLAEVEVLFGDSISTDEEW